MASIPFNRVASCGAASLGETAAWFVQQPRQCPHDCVAQILRIAHSRREEPLFPSATQTLGQRRLAHRPSDWLLGRPVVAGRGFAPRWTLPLLETARFQLRRHTLSREWRGKRLLLERLRGRRRGMVLVGRGRSSAIMGENPTSWTASRAACRNCSSPSITELMNTLVKRTPTCYVEAHREPLTGLDD